MDRIEPIRSGMRSDRHLPHLVVESACSNHSPCPSHRSVCPVELVRKGCAQRTRSAFVVLFEVVERSRVVGSCRAGSGPRSRRRAASLYHHHHHHHHCLEEDIDGSGKRREPVTSSCRCSESTDPPRRALDEQDGIRHRLLSLDPETCCNGTSD